MKIERLFEIVYILLNKKIVTAEELANKFEVSTRTIYRDIDTLCSSGIPIYTIKGKGGGISLVESFILNKSILSENEQDEILIGLQSLNATSYMSTDNILSKLGNLFNRNNKNWIEVDFSDWQCNDKEKDKFTLLKDAVLNSNLIKFEYYNTSGERTNRTVKPLQLLFKSNNWYLKGYCMQKGDFRLFRIHRIRNLELKNEKFLNTFDDEDYKEAFKDCFNENNIKNVKVKMQISSEMSYRVFCEFDEKYILKNSDGSFIVTQVCPEDEWLYSYIMSFGNYAEVIEPKRIRKIIKERFKLALKNY